LSHRTYVFDKGGNKVYTSQSFSFEEPKPSNEYYVSKSPRIYPLTTKLDKETYELLHKLAYENRLKEVEIIERGIHFVKDQINRDKGRSF
jgi:hypothetical protein